MTNFEISKYDIGGKNAIPGDGKLTGSEIKKAKKDGWNVWDGYSTNDSQPEKTPKAMRKEAKAAKKAARKASKNYIDFKRFDKGGKNAIADDGVLTGDEVIRANRAGYDCIFDGDTKEGLQICPSYAKRAKKYAAGCITRRTAYNHKSKFLRGLAMCADMLIMPIELGISLGQALCED